MVFMTKTNCTTRPCISYSASTLYFTVLSSTLTIPQNIYSLQRNTIQWLKTHSLWLHMINAHPQHVKTPGIATHGFIGTTGALPNCTHNFSIFTGPLTILTKKFTSKNVQWTPHLFNWLPWCKQGRYIPIRNLCAKAVDNFCNYKLPSQMFPCSALLSASSIEYRSHQSLVLPRHLDNQGDISFLSNMPMAAHKSSIGFHATMPHEYPALHTASHKMSHIMVDDDSDNPQFNSILNENIQVSQVPTHVDMISHFDYEGPTVAVPETNSPTTVV